MICTGMADNPKHIPDNEPAQRAFVKVSTFFYKLKESLMFDEEKGCLVFNSGDGVYVDIVEVKARLKSPESMFTKLGKDVEGEAYDIRDILAITFILKSMDDTLKLFHALQKRGVILQENTASYSITQTLFESPQKHARSGKAADGQPCTKRRQLRNAGGRRHPRQCQDVL